MSNGQTKTPCSQLVHVTLTELRLVGGPTYRRRCVRSFSPESLRRDRDEERNSSFIYLFSALTRLIHLSFGHDGARAQLLMLLVGLKDVIDCWGGGVSRAMAFSSSAMFHPIPAALFPLVENPSQSRNEEEAKRESAFVDSRAETIAVCVCRRVGTKKDFFHIGTQGTFYHLGLIKVDSQCRQDMCCVEVSCSAEDRKHPVGL
ncbi:hypothetical protein EXN66_Car006902 [Channa argus]|uniref:Uncharacterized protein n=1 Tax=Channa argus TaxID=215402 RepID=A0A6G1PLX3_CHAAH|nr:hypothetical protein EXN66_Car006902 [Channa argus]